MRLGIFEICKVCRMAAGAAVLAAWLPACAPAQTVPAPYRDLYSELQTYLSSFNTQMGSLRGSSSSYPVMYTASLPMADANWGSQVISPTSQAALMVQLQELKAMGVQGVVVDVGFPMLCAPFLTMQNQPYSEYVLFYAQLAVAVRAAGMKLIVENDVLAANGTAGIQWNTGLFLSSLSWTQYQEARAQTAAVIAQTMQPDYLVVVEEPDTEAANSGQATVMTPSGAAGLVSQMLSSVRLAGLPGTKIGAGVGTWLSGFGQFIQAFEAQPVDFIDMHISMVNGSDLPNALTIASMATSAGLPVTVSESWLDKVRDSEIGLLTPDQTKARDPFSFWAPLDSSFVQTMENLANLEKMTFLNVGSSQYFFAYLPYGPNTQNLTPLQIASMEAQQAVEANAQASYTSTGMGYYNAIVTPHDTVPPSTPNNLNGTTVNPTGSSLTWNASTDNVGVAGYSVFRNGAMIGTTATPAFQDSGLAAATTYTYYVEAFDLAGNLSSPSHPVQITTPDTPPGAPSNLTAAAVSPTQMSLKWSAAIGVLPISNYRVFAGTSPNSLSQVAIVTGLTDIVTALNPATTYYFAVEAVDTDGESSALSSVRSAATLAPPSAPGNLTARATAKTKISLTWSPSVGSLQVASYTVYRGGSPASLQQVGVVRTGRTTYTDSTVVAASTYYYAVQAADSQGNLSPVSAVTQVATPK